MNETKTTLKTLLNQIRTVVLELENFYYSLPKIEQNSLTYRRFLLSHRKDIHDGHILYERIEQAHEASESIIELLRSVKVTRATQGEYEELCDKIMILSRLVMNEKWALKASKKRKEKIKYKVSQANNKYVEEILEGFGLQAFHEMTSLMNASLELIDIIKESDHVYDTVGYEDSKKERDTRVSQCLQLGNTLKMNLEKGNCVDIDNIEKAMSQFMLYYNNNISYLKADEKIQTLLKSICDIPFVDVMYFHFFAQQGGKNFYVFKDLVMKKKKGYDSDALQELVKHGIVVTNKIVEQFFDMIEKEIEIQKYSSLLQQESEHIFDAFHEMAIFFTGKGNLTQKHFELVFHNEHSKRITKELIIEKLLVEYIFTKITEDPRIIDLASLQQVDLSMYNAILLISREKYIPIDKIMEYFDKEYIKNNYNLFQFFKEFQEILEKLVRDDINSLDSGLMRNWYKYLEENKTEFYLSAEEAENIDKFVKSIDLYKKDGEGIEVKQIELLFRSYIKLDLYNFYNNKYGKISLNRLVIMIKKYYRILQLYKNLVDEKSNANIIAFEKIIYQVNNDIVQGKRNINVELIIEYVGKIISILKNKDDLNFVLQEFLEGEKDNLYQEIDKFGLLEVIDDHQIIKNIFTFFPMSNWNHEHINIYLIQEIRALKKQSLQESLNIQDYIFIAYLEFLENMKNKLTLDEEKEKEIIRVFLTTHLIEESGLNAVLKELENKKEYFNFLSKSLSVNTTFQAHFQRLLNIVSFFKYCENNNTLQGQSQYFEKVNVFELILNIKYTESLYKKYQENIIKEIIELQRNNINYYIDIWFKKEYFDVNDNDYLSKNYCRKVLQKLLNKEVEYKSGEEHEELVDEFYRLSIIKLLKTSKIEEKMIKVLISLDRESNIRLFEEVEKVLYRKIIKEYGILTIDQKKVEAYCKNLINDDGEYEYIHYYLTLQGHNKIKSESRKIILLRKFLEEVFIEMLYYDKLTHKDIETIKQTFKETSKKESILSILRGNMIYWRLYRSYALYLTVLVNTIKIKTTKVDEYIYSLYIIDYLNYVYERLKSLENREEGVQIEKDSTINLNSLLDKLEVEILVKSYYDSFEILMFDLKMKIARIKVEKINAGKMNFTSSIYANLVDKNRVFSEEFLNNIEFILSWNLGNFINIDKMLKDGENLRRLSIELLKSHYAISKFIEIKSEFKDVGNERKGEIIALIISLYEYRGARIYEDLEDFKKDVTWYEDIESRLRGEIGMKHSKEVKGKIEQSWRMLIKKVITKEKDVNIKQKHYEMIEKALENEKLYGLKMFVNSDDNNDENEMEKSDVVKTLLMIYIIVVESEKNFEDKNEKLITKETIQWIEGKNALFYKKNETPLYKRLNNLICVFINLNDYLIEGGEMDEKESIVNKFKGYTENLEKSLDKFMEIEYVMNDFFGLPGTEEGVKILFSQYVFNAVRFILDKIDKLNLSKISSRSIEAYINPNFKLDYSYIYHILGESILSINKLMDSEKILEIIDINQKKNIIDELLELHSFFICILFELFFDKKRVMKSNEGYNYSYILNTKDIESVSRDVENSVDKLYGKNLKGMHGITKDEEDVLFELCKSICHIEKIIIDLCSKENSLNYNTYVRANMENKINKAIEKAKRKIEDYAEVYIDSMLKDIKGGES